MSIQQRFRHMMTDISTTFGTIIVIITIAIDAKMDFDLKRRGESCCPMCNRLRSKNERHPTERIQRKFHKISWFITSQILGNGRD